MRSKLLLWLLGAALMLPCTGALDCYSGTDFMMEQNMTQNLIHLTSANTITCGAGEVCQETILLTESGLRSTIVTYKGCTADGITASGPSKITGAGFTIISYTRVCNSDLCNGINSTDSLLNLTLPAAPSNGSHHCPSCVALGSSCSNPVSLPCPEDTSHCYQGLFQFIQDGIQIDFSIQGCASIANTSCHLLSDIQDYVPISVKEECQIVPNKVSTTTVQGWAVGAGLLLALWGYLPQL
ncbi:CD177 antigen-like [Notamacropus eugenii]|uniref:CD177 antigen-like n=1 Tax=Notamacropus eugenii TaxID=9315 RepID=UPI003B67096D